MSNEKSQLTEITNFFEGNKDQVVRLLLTNGFIAPESNKKGANYALTTTGEALLTLIRGREIEANKSVTEEIN